MLPCRRPQVLHMPGPEMAKQSTHGAHVRDMLAAGSAVAARRSRGLSQNLVKNLASMSAGGTDDGGEWGGGSQGP